MGNTVNEEKREETLGIVKDAIAYMLENGMRVSKAEIARTSGLHINTLGQPYIKEYLDTVDALKNRKKYSIPHAELISQNERLESMLKKSRHENSRLRDENEKLRQKNHLITEKYRFLLGDYVMKIGKPIEHI